MASSSVHGSRKNRLWPIRHALDEGLDVGEDTEIPVNLSYGVLFKFTGKIDKVTIDLKPMEPVTAQENKKHQREAALRRDCRSERLVLHLERERHQEPVPG